ncbi:MAG: hypothetical protein ACO26G_05080 [Rickettsiales bacterium]|jgi:flagellin-specific chaperone FliS
MQNPPLTLPIFEPKIKYNGDPRNSLERIFEHYMNSTNNEVLIHESKCFENIFEKKDNLVTEITDIKRAIELIYDSPHNRKIFELYEIIKERFNGDQQEIKNAEKIRFMELIQINQPPIELTLMLLKNIDKFSLKSDFHIMEKLNSNKNNSEDCKKIFDETLEKFRTCLDENEKEIFDKEMKKIYSLASRRVSISSSSSQAGSQPQTPMFRSSRGSFELTEGIGLLDLERPNHSIKPSAIKSDPQPKNFCAIS